MTPVAAAESLPERFLAREIADKFAALPAVQEVLRGVEAGGAVSFEGIHPAAHGFLAAFLSLRFPERAIVAVAEGVKAQEALQQDVETWRSFLGARGRPLFYPSWEVLPHETRLPHADVISERLQTLLVPLNSMILMRESTG